MNNIEKVRIALSVHMDAILAYFRPGALITIIVRFPDDKDGVQDFMMGNDDPEEVVKLIERRLAEPEHVVMPDVPEAED